MGDVLKEKLANFLSKSGTKEDEDENLDEDLFKEEYLKIRGAGHPTGGTYKVIPIFYQPLPKVSIKMDIDTLKLLGRTCLLSCAVQYGTCFSTGGRRIATKAPRGGEGTVSSATVSPASRQQ